MKAITVEPNQPGTARLEDVPEPDPREGSTSLLFTDQYGACVKVKIVDARSHHLTSPDTGEGDEIEHRIIKGIAISLLKVPGIPKLRRSSGTSIPRVPAVRTC